MGGCVSSTTANKKAKKPEKGVEECSHTKAGHENWQTLKALASRLSSHKPPLKAEPHAKELPFGNPTFFGYSTGFQDHYSQDKLIGSGQFGRTYRATHLGTNGQYAVKILEKSKMLQPIAVEDVKREVKIMKILSGNENIVQFEEVYEDENYVYIVMELCEGGELLDRILAKKNSQYSEKDAAVIVRQMLRVAASCHLHGIVHRDLKPENFLFKSESEDSILKTTDFGLSDFIRPGKRFRDVVGSAYYVAPEVLKRRSGPESDVWSIGVITYILLCGRRPFWGKTGDGVFKEVLKKAPNIHDKPWQTISQGAKDFVLKLLCKDPKARLSAAQALSHPWVREGGEALDIPLDISVLSNMREFVTYSRLKRIAFRALASTLDPDEITNLHDQFNAIDTDKSGTITLDEMKKALAKDQPWKLKDDKVSNILDAMDNNGDGLVDFEEFVAAALHVYQLELDTSKWQKCTLAAFQKVDIDHDGYITPDELRMYTGITGSVETILDEGDTDKDGRISLEEFRRLLRRASFRPPIKELDFSR